MRRFPFKFGPCTFKNIKYPISVNNPGHNFIIQQWLVEYCCVLNYEIVLGPAKKTNINFDFIITVCDHANENCPFIPSKNAVRLHHNFSDPSQVNGKENEKHAAFLKARNEIREYCKTFVEGKY